MSGRLAFRTFVPGIPRPKGSLEPQRRRGGDGKLTGGVRLVDSPQSKRWRRTMALAFRESSIGEIEPITGPVMVSATFWFDRDDYVVRADSEWPDHPHIGDLDKLLRNLLDALQVDDTGEGNGAGIIKDDRQVIKFIEPTGKWWAPEGGNAGVSVEVWEWTP